MDELKFWISILFAAAGAVFGAGGTWAIMRFQVKDLRERAKGQDAIMASHAETLGNHRDRITRLEERHDGLVDKLDAAIGSLKAVTGKLEALAITIASGQKGHA